jgi:hypothetical protein
MRCREGEVASLMAGRNLRFALLPVLAAWTLAAHASCTPFQAANFGASDQPAYTDAYGNAEYGYRITVPHGLVAYGAPLPGPNTGVGILLRAEPDGYAWVDGSHNVYDGVANARDYLDMLQRYPDSREKILASRRGRIRLGGRDGTLQVTRYRCAPNGPVRVERQAVVVFRDKVYAVGLDTSADNDARDARVFSSLVSSWRFDR